MQNRRRVERIADFIPISYRIPPDPKIENFLTRDISTLGVKFLMKDFVSKGTLIELNINLKKVPFSFRIFSTVRWIVKDPSGDRYEVGAEFNNISNAYKEKLSSYMEEFLKK